jgi:predicted ATP-grasp superfamily ATP-dependent carboligase
VVRSIASGPYCQAQGGTLDTNELVREREPELARALLVTIAPAAETIAAAKELNLDVAIIGPDGNRPSDCPFYPVDLGDEAAVRELLHELAARQNVAGVISSEGPFVRAAAECAAILGVPHALSVEAAARGENKLLARRAYDAAGVRGPRYHATASAREAVAFAEQIGFPVVVKPLNDQNSRFVRLCRNRDDVEAALASVAQARFNAGGQPLAPEILIEEFVNGPEYSVELFVERGAATVVGICAKALGPPPFFVEIGHSMPAAVSDKQAAEISRTAVDAVAALGADNCVAHVELRVRREQAYIIEVNLRVAGGRLSDLVSTVTGYDLAGIELDLALGRPTRAPRTPETKVGVYHCMTVEAPSVVRYGQDPIELGDVWPAPILEIDVPSGSTVYPVNDPRGRIFGRILAFGDHPTKAWSTVRTIRSLLRLQTEPVSDTTPHTVADSPGSAKSGCC